MCGPVPYDIPIDQTQTEQVNTEVSSALFSTGLSPVSVAGTLDVTGEDALLVPSTAPPVTSVTNTGTIVASAGSHGINNQGVISKVLNAQGAGNVNGPLTYTGNLPGSYQVIINSTTDYGMLSVETVTGPMAFGIYSGDVDGLPSSVLTETTYTSVLQGFNTLTDVSGISGIFANSFSYSLVQQNATSNWDLVVQELPSITTGSSIDLSAIGVTVKPVFDGGTLLLDSGDDSTLDFDVLSAGGYITAPDEGSATLSGLIFGVGALTFNGTGTTILSGANTYSGGTTVNGGVLRLGAASAVPAGALTVGAGGTFDLNNVNQTVTDLSGSGAVTLGSATLTAGSTADTTFSGVISGTGGLTKDGSGTLTLSGTNTYTGHTSVNTGTLSIAGTSATGRGSVTIETGATLSGQGNIVGKLTVFGTLKPGNSPGFMSATSDVTMEVNSTYLQDIAGTVQADASTVSGMSGYYAYLNVQGVYTINQGATLTPRLSNLFTASQPGYGSEAYAPALGDRFRIITADGGIVGKFATLTQPDGLRLGTAFAAFYDMQNSNSVDLAVIPSSYTDTMAGGLANENGLSVGQALDNIAQANQRGEATDSQDQLLSVLAAQKSAGAIANYAQSLAGEVYAATVAVNAQNSQRVQQTIRARLKTAHRAATLSNHSDGNNQPATKTASSDQHVWGDAGFQRGVRSSDSHSGGWNSNLYQATFGADLYASESVLAGGGFSLSNTTLNPTYGSATIEQGSIFAYGQLNIQNYAIDAVASLGLSSSDISRADITELSNGFRDKSVYGKDATLSLGMSRQFELTSAYVTPYAQVTWQGAMQESVSEGDTPAALTIDRFNGSSVRGVLGLATNSKGSDPSTEKYTYGAYIGIGADSNHLLNPTLNATLADQSTSITTPDAGRVFIQGGFYGTARISSETYVYLGVSGEARQNQKLGSINAGIQMRF